MSDKPDEKAKGGFWTTLPGVFTGATGLLAATTALIVALNEAGLLSPQSGEISSSSPSSTPTPNESVGTSNTPELPPESSTATPTQSSPPPLIPSSTLPPSVSPDTAFFTIVYSPLNQEDADARAKEIRINYPNLNIEVRPPFRSNQHYSVTVASWTSKATALEICRFARREGIAPDPFVWTFSTDYIPCN